MSADALHPSRRQAIAGLAACATGLLLGAERPALAAIPGARLRSAGNGDVRALIVGIDAYEAQRPLKGAVADARDLAAQLAGAGVSDVTTLLDRQASRAAIVKAITTLLARSMKGDLVVIGFAGHGTQVPEFVPNSKPDHLDEVYVLSRYSQATAQSRAEVIIGPEMKRWLKQFDDKGVDVLFVADTCHGGGLTRDVDPRDADLSYRSAVSVSVELDGILGAQVTPADSLLTESAFRRVTFVAAADRFTKVPEVRIPGEETLRGALSYSVARMLAGNAPVADGGVTRRALFAFARQVAWQYSNSRQSIYTEPTGTGSLDDVVFRFVVPTPAPTPAAPARPSTPVKVGANAPRPRLAPVTIGVLNGGPERLSALRPFVHPFRIVAAAAMPDLLFDAATGDVLQAGDVVRRGARAEELPAIVDRTAAIQAIKRMSELNPATFRIAGSDRLRRNGDTARLSADVPAGSHLLVFNVAGNGIVQLLFPIGPESSRSDTGGWSIGVQVAAPFGADLIVAIESDQPLDDVETGLRSLHGRAAAGLLPDLLDRAVASRPSTRIGLAGLFTAP